MSKQTRSVEADAVESKNGSKPQDAGAEPASTTPPATAAVPVPDPESGSDTSPFGGLTIDFSGDTGVAAPYAPAPISPLTIAFGEELPAPAPGQSLPSSSSTRMTNGAPRRTR